MGMDAINGISNYQSQVKPVEIAASNSIDISAVSASMGSTPTQNSLQNQSKSAQQPTQEEIQSAISSANKRAHFGHTNAQFSYHEQTHSISVKIMDAETNEVIKEIPSEETLEMISKMWELAGIMVDEKR